MNKEQKQAIKCAYADLVGALQAQKNCDVMSHDWDAHRLSIIEMEAAFPTVIEPAEGVID